MISLSRSSFCLSLLTMACQSALAEQSSPRPSDVWLPDDGVEKVVVVGQRTNPYLVEQASGASKLTLSLDEIPQSVSVLSAQQLGDFDLNSLNDAMANTVGVNVEQVETDRTYYTARGFDITNFQVDGLGLPVFSGNTHGDIDTAIYERIEVIRGANGMMTGIGNPSATINMVRKKPTQALQGSVQLQRGSWDTHRLDVDVSGSLTDGVRGRAVLAYQNGDSYLDRYGLEKQLAYGVIEADLSADTLLRVGVSRQNSEAQGNMWGALTLYYGDGSATNFDRSTNTSADWSRWDVEDTRYFTTLEHRLNEQWSLTAAYSRRETDEDSLLFYTYLVAPLDPDTGLGLQGYASEYDLDDKHDLMDVYVRGEFGAWGQQHEVVVGLNYSKMAYQDISLYDFHSGKGFPPIPAMPSWDGNVDFPELTDTSDAYYSDVTERQKAAYVATRWSLNDTTALMVGARYNDISVDGISYAQDEGLSDQELIPYVGLVYQVTSNTNLYASYTETYRGQTERNAQRERLPAVTGQAREIGVKHSLSSQQGLLTLAYFDITQADLAVFGGNTTDENGIVYDYFVPAEGITSQGFEVELTGELLQGVQGSIGYTQFDIDGDQTVEAYTPEKMLRLALTYSPSALEGLTLGASVQWQGAISRQQGVVSDGFANAGEAIVSEQSAYTKVNLMARYQISASVALTANINNLSDEKYLTSLYWAQSYYGAPRNGSVAIHWTF
ncbi:TonB-dependent siderophore receptor [Aestuariibacter halophilus]|uniref:TonB-dependent siderophore receptor n=1 Tax=Fluctibacter halophilus TaxID=226011 RepID=A0ABS8GBT9_9ALTE|nr:TonB-dependent siderophore receptor [Aestuariibacter halophilus]MCC2617280.1 TonB-dependent siderophore receptor [Aestuariibacter halophilus]